MTAQLRIVSDGTAPGTHVFAGDEEIDSNQITGVSWTISAHPPGLLAYATLDLLEVPVDIVGERTP